MQSTREELKKKLSIFRVELDNLVTNNMSCINQCLYETIEHSIKKKTCSLCQEIFSRGDLIMATFCQHFFHKDCLEMELMNGNKQCPDCNIILQNKYQKEFNKFKQFAEKPNITPLAEIPEHIEKSVNSNSHITNTTNSRPHHKDSKMCLENNHSETPLLSMVSDERLFPSSRQKQQEFKLSDSDINLTKTKVFEYKTNELGYCIYSNNALNKQKKKSRKKDVIQHLRYTE